MRLLLKLALVGTCLAPILLENVSAQDNIAKGASGVPITEISQCFKKYCSNCVMTHFSENNFIEDEASIVINAKISYEVRALWTAKYKRNWGFIVVRKENGFKCIGATLVEGSRWF